MQLKQVIERVLEENREIFAALDQEARIYSGVLIEKLASQLDLAYKNEFVALEAALKRAEQRVTNLENRLAQLEKETKPED